MPNWCSNRWELSGSEADVRAAVKLLTDETEPEGAGVFFDRICTASYTIRREASRIEWTNPQLAVLHFDTAREPPADAFHELCLRFPEVDISAFYDEPHMRTAGYLERVVPVADPTA